MAGDPVSGGGGGEIPSSRVELLGRVPFCNVWAPTNVELGERPTTSSGTDIAMIVGG